MDTPVIPAVPTFYDLYGSSGDEDSDRTRSGDSDTVDGDSTDEEPSDSAEERRDLRRWVNRLYFRRLMHVIINHWFRHRTQIRSRLAYLFD